MFLFSSADFLQNYVFKNKLPRTTISVSNSWIQIKTDILLVFIWVQTVCKRLLADDKIIHWHAELKQINNIVFNILSHIGIYMHHVYHKY